MQGDVHSAGCALLVVYFLAEDTGKSCCLQGRF